MPIPGWRVVGERLAQRVAFALELPALIVGERVERELLGAGAREQGPDAGDQWIAWRRQLGVGVQVPSGDVEARLLAVARHRGVAPLAVELLAPEHEGAVDRGALGAVGGDRIAMLEVAGVEVAGAERDRLSPIEGHGEAARLPVRGGDRAALPVEDPGSSVVLGTDDPVARREGSVSDGELIGSEPAVVLEELPGALVQVADVFATCGDHQPVAVGA